MVFRCICLVSVLATSIFPSLGQSNLDKGFSDPPSSAKIRAYWWWLNGNVTRESIKRDLEEMAAKGFGGALICDANGAEQFGNSRVPHGPDFFSPEWRELYKFTLNEAHRLGLEMSLNIQSGWNLGGPMVRAEDAPKKLVWSELTLSGGQIETKLEIPKHAPELYRDIAVIAYPVAQSYDPARRKLLKNWEHKAMAKGLSWSAPRTEELLDNLPDAPGDAATTAKGVLDITKHLSKDGALRWRAPAGRWEILRIGYTLNDHCRVSTQSDGWDGYAIDPFDRGAFQRYWDTVVEPLIKDAGALAGNTLKYLHTDSWEVEVANWTPTLRSEFKKRRGYDMWPYLPVMAGRIVDGRTVSNRFLNDLRRTVGDLAIDNHFRPFRDNAHRHGLLIHPESGGPHAVPIDSLQCLGMNDAPMSEFWATSWMHRVKDEDRFFVKQPASAAHTYGHNLVLAEGFTTIGPHWQETLWDNLKPNFDEASCQGLNRLVWHAFVCSPDSTGIPGQQYFAGTHLNPKVTWWPMSKPFFDYMNRCQFMLQQGKFVADVLYYYGDHVPNFTQLQKSDPAHVLPGYDYDVATEEVILNRLKVKDGRLVLPDGMSYCALVLPDRRVISLRALRKIKALVKDGATVVGPRPFEPTTLASMPQSDQEVRDIAQELWGGTPPKSYRPYGKGWVVTIPVREYFEFRKISPDFNVESASPELSINYIHRQTSDGEIYFVTNRANATGKATLSFRVTGKVPERWDPTTGTSQPFRSWKVKEGRTQIELPMERCDSLFVVFRKDGLPPTTPGTNFETISPVQTLTEPWTVNFDPRWGGPAESTFTQLTDWSKNEDPRIKFYSGAATYSTRFDYAGSGESVYLDLGEIRELAEITLNGKSLGIVWKPPFRVRVDPLLKPTDNRLEVKVVNFWPNRIIGDASKPVAERLTRTNILKLTAESPLMPSGLMGPVQLIRVTRS